jgi:hypothetical protein
MQNDAIALVFGTAVGVGLICGAVHAVWHGKLQMREGYVWQRSEDPDIFWILTLYMAGLGVLAILLGTRPWLRRWR